jgi:hypothetical protein
VAPQPKPSKEDPGAAVSDITGAEQATAWVMGLIDQVDLQLRAHSTDRIDLESAVDFGITNWGTVTLTALRHAVDPKHPRCVEVHASLSDLQGNITSLMDDNCPDHEVLRQFKRHLIIQYVDPTGSVLLESLKGIVPGPDETLGSLLGKFQRRVRLLVTMAPGNMDCTAKQLAALLCEHFPQHISFYNAMQKRQEEPRPEYMIRFLRNQTGICESLRPQNIPRSQ